MEEEINRIIEEGKKKKTSGVDDKNIAIYVSLELGKLFIYDTNYTAKTILNEENQEVKTKLTIERQNSMKNAKTNVYSKRQGCKGMAEMYAAVLSEIGIEARVVGVESKENTEGFEYDCRFEMVDGKKVIVTGENDAQYKGNHYYSICFFKNSEEVFIQDFLTEGALTRIKVGEEEGKEDVITGFHTKDEHKNRTVKPKEISERFRLSQPQEFEDNKSKMDYIFSELQKYTEIFGFEEAKNYIDIIKGITNIDGKLSYLNLVKESETSCELICIYKLDKYFYLLRDGMITDLPPLGCISQNDIKAIINMGFAPRTSKDEKKLDIFLDAERIVQNDVSIEKVDN